MASNPISGTHASRLFKEPLVHFFVRRPFARQLADLEVDRWAGPIRSGFGMHLVRIDTRTDGRLPELEEVRDALLREWSTIAAWAKSPWEDDKSSSDWQRQTQRGPTDWLRSGFQDCGLDASSRSTTRCGKSSPRGEFNRSTIYAASARASADAVRTVPAALMHGLFCSVFR